MSREPVAPRSGRRLSGAARTALVLLAASPLATLAPAGMRAQTAQTDSAAVRARIEAYRAAWNTHDPSAVAAFFSVDADFVMGNQPEAVGRRAIQGWWSDYFSHQEPERQLKLDVLSVRLVSAHVAVVNVATTTGGRDHQGRNLLARRFRGSWVVRREGGEWLISAMRGLPTEEDRVVLNKSVAATEELRPEIRAFVDAYEDAFNSHDPSAVSASYADDADIIVRNGPVTHGQQAIEEWWARYFAEDRPSRTILIVKGIRMLTPNVALIDLVATGAVGGPAPDGAPVGYARATCLLARQDDRWLMTALWVLPSEGDRIIRGGGG